MMRATHRAAEQVREMMLETEIIRKGIVFPPSRTLSRTKLLA